MQLLSRDRNTVLLEWRVPAWEQAHRRADLLRMLRGAIWRIGPLCLLLPFLFSWLIHHLTGEAIAVARVLPYVVAVPLLVLVAPYLYLRFVGKTDPPRWVQLRRGGIGFRADRASWPIKQPWRWVKAYQLGELGTHSVLKLSVRPTLLPWAKPLWLGYDSDEVSSETIREVMSELVGREETVELDDRELLS